jgi:hypothetical protein
MLGVILTRRLFTSIAFSLAVILLVACNSLETALLREAAPLLGRLLLVDAPIAPKSPHFGSTAS